MGEWHSPELNFNPGRTPFAPTMMVAETIDLMLSYSFMMVITFSSRQERINIFMGF